MWQIPACFDAAYARTSGVPQGDLCCLRTVRASGAIGYLAQALVDEWTEIHLSRSLSPSQVDDLTQRIARSLHRAFQRGQSLPSGQP
jgi:hypothetical protein